MKKLILLFFIIAFIGCETKTIEVPVKGGEIMLGKNKGSKFYIAPDENVDIVKKLLNLNINPIYYSTFCSTEKDFHNCLIYYQILVL